MGEFIFRSAVSGRVFVQLPTKEDGTRVVGFWADAKKLRQFERLFREMAELLESGSST